jgi:3-dehydrosphinganine reductase
MYTSGHEIENQKKPKLTLQIEETDSGLTAEQAAEGLMKSKRCLDTA